MPTRGGGGDGGGGGSGELRISNAAAAADAGRYDCEARNPYGVTRKRVLVAVVAAPPPGFRGRYRARPGGILEIPGLRATGRVADVLWRKDGLVVDPEGEENLVLTKTGSLRLTNVTAASRGVYSLTLTSDTGRVKTYNAVVELKTFAHTKEEAKVVSGGDLELRCDLVDSGGSSGVAARTIWRREEKLLEEDKEKIELREGGNLLVVKDVQPGVDDGTYSCSVTAATAADERSDLGRREVVEFDVTVEEADAIVVDERCREAADQSARITSVHLAGNDSVSIRWSVVGDDGDDSECFQRAVLALWTNATESVFQEKTLELSSSSTTPEEVSGLQPGVAYYSQVNLVSALGLYVYGETRSFSLDGLERETAEGQVGGGGDGEDEGGSLTSARTALAAALGTLAAVIALVAAAFVWRRRRRRRRRNDMDRFGGGGGILSSCTCCQATSSSPYSKGGIGGSSSSRRRRKGRIVGAPLDVYEGNVLQVAPLSPDDFMRNLAPQWPEPEPGAPAPPSATATGSTSVSAHAQTPAEVMEVMVVGAREEREESPSSPPQPQPTQPTQPTETDAFLQTPNGGLAVPSR